MGKAREIGWGKEWAALHRSSFLHKLALRKEKDA